MKLDCGNGLLVIVPAHNESTTIGEVVHDIKRHAPQADLLVINDGSEDSTSARARKAGACVLDLPYNVGIGGAVQTGYAFAVEMGYSIVVRLDGDGQHNAEELPDLVGPIMVGQADVVIGSRYVKGRGYQASLPRAIGIKLFAVLVSYVAGQRLTDTTSGFQAVNRSTAGFLARYLPTDYPEVEGLVLLCRAGFRVCEVPVFMRPRRAGESSITPLRAVYYVLKVLLAIVVGLLRDVPERRGVIVGTG